MKSYEEIANNIFARRAQYIEEQKRKKKSIIKATSVACSLVVVIVFGVWQSGGLNSIQSNPSDQPMSTKTSSSNENTPGNNPYPYEEKIQYLPKEIPVSKFRNVFFAYNQEKNVDPIIVNLYASLYDLSQLRRDLHPDFSDDGTVSFSRKSYYPDTDEVRYLEMQKYLGEDNNLLHQLSTLPQKTNKSINCLLMQNGKDKETIAVGFESEIYENCVLNVIVSDDFDLVKNDEIKSQIHNMRELTDSYTASEINNKALSVIYVFQTRYCAEKDVDEERYVYYTFFRQDGQEYLVQFTTNYTLSGSNKDAYGNLRRTQDECKLAFEEIIQELL